MTTHRRHPRHVWIRNALIQGYTCAECGMARSALDSNDWKHYLADGTYVGNRCGPCPRSANDSPKGGPRT